MFFQWLMALCIISSTIHSFEDCYCYYLNEKQLPVVISPKRTDISAERWAQTHREALQELLQEHGAILFRDFPIPDATIFSLFMREGLGFVLNDYIGGEGSRERVIPGIFTSTSAPPEFAIPLHHELSCTDQPLRYIAFYCEIAPDPATGQTNLGSTEEVTQALLQHPNVWDLYSGRTIKYISRHPPEGSFFTRVNPTHRTWQDSFGTEDKRLVERICKEKGFKYQWSGDWLEVTRLAPAMLGPDEYFDHPYWYNQSYLYHANPRIRGGWLNHLLANLLYIVPSTRQYDVELADGTPIPQEVIYEIYDVLEHCVAQFDWQKGDLLLIDNRKTLHGRAATSGPRRILAAMVK